MSIRSLVACIALELVAACGAPCRAPEEAEPPSAGLENGTFTADLNGRQIHYEVHGAGPVVMTVPNSWGLSLEGLRNLYRPLEARVTMVYFDPRGMGGSSPAANDEDLGMEAVREDFLALRTHLGVNKVHAIGWSNGAMNLILLAAEAPRVLASATFVHGAAYFDEEDMKRMAEKEPELMAAWAQHELELQAPELSPEERTARMKAFWIGYYFPRATANPDTALQLLKDAFEPAQFSYRHATYNRTHYQQFDTRDKLAEIAVRSLVIAGAADMIPPDKVRELADGLPYSTFELFESAGHFAPLEEPEHFQRVVLDFWCADEDPPPS